MCMTRPRQRGFTLVELIIFIVVVSTALAEAPSTYYSWQVIMPARYYTREEGEIGKSPAAPATIRHDPAT